MPKSKIQQVENYVKRTMTKVIAHNFKHVDRVRNWSLQIAQEEGYQDLETIEVTALLHDIGLLYVEESSMHGPIGAQTATRFLKENGLFAEEKIKEIANAIRYHSSPRDGSGKLLEILRDADMMDAFGAIGIMRAFTSKSSKPEYNPENVKSDTWEITSRGFNQRFDKGLGIGDYIIDQINFQISYYDNLSTETAKQLAKPLVEFMKNYIIQLENEINQGRKEVSR